MATVQNGIISYDDYLQFIYQCHNTVATQFSTWYNSSYAPGPSPDNHDQQSNGLRDKINKLRNIITGPFQYRLPGGQVALGITTPSLPYTVEEEYGTLVSTGGTYDKSKITIGGAAFGAVTKNSIITAQLILGTLRAFYASDPTPATQGTKAGALDIRTPDLSSIIRGGCSSCVVSCNVSCGQGCAYNCGRSWACSDCRGSCRSCKGIAGCGTCGGECTYHCGGGCAYDCSGKCNTCTGTCVNLYSDAK